MTIRELKSKLQIMYSHGRFGTIKDYHKLRDQLVSLRYDALSNVSQDNVFKQDYDALSVAIYVIDELFKGEVIK